jgi:hypothetical protein
MAARASGEIDVSAYSVAVATNGAFGFRATASDGAVAAARANLRKRLAAMEAAGTAAPPPAAPRLRPSKQRDRRTSRLPERFSARFGNRDAASSAKPGVDNVLVIG